MASELQRVVNQIDFTAFDFFSIKQALLQYLKINYPDDFNDFVESSTMVALIETLAYTAELIAYRVDMNTHETMLETSENRANVLKILKLIGYQSSRAASSSGPIKLFMKEDTPGSPTTDAYYIAGLPRWIFNPDLLALVGVGELTTNGVYATHLENHIPFEVSVGVETLTYELTSVSYSLGLVEESLSTQFLSLVFDGTYWICNAKQGKTLTETFSQDIAEANLEYIVSHTNNDQTTPVISIAGEEWTYTSNLYLPDVTTSQKFGTRHDELDRMTIVFGDGIASAIPLGDITIQYRKTDGKKGDISTSLMNDISITKVLENPTAGDALETVELHITATAAFTGGAEPESLDTMKRHGPAIYASQNRQVTGPDYVVSVLEVPGVSVAKAVQRTYVGHDASGTYSSAAFVGIDASTGTISSFKSATDFAGAVPGIDTISRVTEFDIDSRHVITSTLPGPTGSDLTTIWTTADEILDTGTDTTGSGTLVLNDTAATFITDGIKVGMGIANTTDGSVGEITAVNSEIQLECTLSGGTLDVWTISDAYDITAWDSSWSGNYMWRHWAGNVNGATYFLASSSAAGEATFDLVLEGHFVDGAKILVVDHYTGNWFNVDVADNIYVLPPSTTSTTVLLRDGAGVLQSGFTPAGGLTMIIDYTFQSEDTTTGYVVPSTPAPDPLGDFFYYTSDTDPLNPGDILWERSSDDGYLVLDIERRATNVATVDYDQIFVGRNSRTGAPTQLIATAVFDRSIFLKNVQVLLTPSKTNIIDLYILDEDSNGYPISYPLNVSTIQEVKAELTETAMISDTIFVQWGAVKKLLIDMDVYLNTGILNASELENKIQQSVYEYFKLGRYEFGESFKTSQLINYLHQSYPEIDYITHTVLDSVDKTAAEHEMISVDTSYSGVSIV